MPFYTRLQIQDRDDVHVRRVKGRTADRLLALQTALKQHLTGGKSESSTRGSVRIATWNVRAFGGSAQGGRGIEPIHYIAEIISHFDVVALQEVQSDFSYGSDFRRLMRILGPDWDFLATDVTDGAAGNGERMVFTFNRRRVRFRNVMGELTLPEGDKLRAAFGERLWLENETRVRLPEGVDLSGTYDAYTSKRDEGGRELRKDLAIELPPGTTLTLPDGSHLVLKKGTPIENDTTGEAEVVVPHPDVEGEAYGVRFPPGTLEDSFRQFARTPFLISFQAGWLKINLCTVHVFYGGTDAAILEYRRQEIEALTRALAKKAKGELAHDSESYLGVLGDFNITEPTSPLMQALESNGFLVPDELKSIPGTNVKRDKTYDQIAFWNPSRPRRHARLDVIGAGVFDFFEHVYTYEDESTYQAEGNRNDLADGPSYETWRTYKMSDHLPMWVELRTDFSNEYLRKIAADGS